MCHEILLFLIGSHDEPLLGIDECDYIQFEDWMPSDENDTGVFPVVVVSYFWNRDRDRYVVDLDLSSTSSKDEIDLTDLLSISFPPATSIGLASTISSSRNCAISYGRTIPSAPESSSP